MESADDRITYIGKTSHRNAGIPFGIRQRDRRSHMYVIGKTGTGKSHLLRVMIEQDLKANLGLALFDPHGDLAESVRRIAEEQGIGARLTYFDAANPGTWRFNPFKIANDRNRALAASGVIDVFKRLWPDEWGPRLEHLLRNVLLTLLESPDATIADIPPLLTDRDHRSGVVEKLNDPVVRDFWKGEFERYSPPFRAVIVAPLQNKIGALLTDPVLRRILTEPGEQLDLRAIMTGGQALIVNLDKGRIGEGACGLLGSLLLSHIALEGLSRSSQAESQRKDFLVFLDEFQTFTTLSVALMLSELRKYRVGMVLAHQHLTQLETEIRDAVFGNVGTLLSFRVGGQDAAFVARELAPKFDGTDLISLPKFEMYVRLQIDGAGSPPFSALTVDQVPQGKPSV